jgi:hypothetical protein
MSLKVPRKSPRKRLRVRVDDKISLTAKRGERGVLWVPVKIRLAIKYLEK